VRRRLDFSHPVEPEVIQTCLELDAQAPTAGNSQGWHFVVVTDAEQRRVLGAIYHKGYWFYWQQAAATHPHYVGRALPQEQSARIPKVRSSSEYLAEQLSTDVSSAGVELEACVHRELTKARKGKMR
jgi:nitroreductase